MKYKSHNSPRQDYCRVDYDNNHYEYFLNDTPLLSEKHGHIYDWYNSYIAKHKFHYIRIKRLDKLPDGKQLGKVYTKPKS